MRVRYISTEEFTNDFINSLRDDRKVAFKRRYRDCDVLLVDDRNLQHRHRTVGAADGGGVGVGATGEGGAERGQLPLRAQRLDALGKFGEPGPAARAEDRAHGLDDLGWECDRRSGRSRHGLSLAEGGGGAQADYRLPQGVPGDVPPRVAMVGL